MKPEGKCRQRALNVVLQGLWCALWGMGATDSFKWEGHSFKEEENCPKINLHTQ